MVATLQAKNAEVRRELSIITKDLQHNREDTAHRKEKEKRLIESIATLEKEIQEAKKDIRYQLIIDFLANVKHFMNYREREETISEKEKRMLDLRKSKVELMVVKVERPA
jgi:hypothetical protein